MSNRTARLSGLDEVLNMLERMGKEGDKIAREASTKAATLIRQTYLVQVLGGGTGLNRRTIMRYTYVKRATPKYQAARINFSGAGVPATEYKYKMKRLSATRAQILVNWLGGTKLAAGFINPSSKTKTPLSTRSQKLLSNGKNYTYKRSLETASAPSIATLYLDLPEERVENKASEMLSNELVLLLDELLGDK